MAAYPQGESSNHDGWARSVVAGLVTPPETIDHTLVSVLHGTAVLSEENALRRADAIRAAALGLPPAACAAAAGISEALLSDWREQDPSFHAAMASVQAMAQAHGRHGDEPGFSAPELRLVLSQVASGSTLAAATALVGYSTAVLRRLRSRNPLVNALVNASTTHRQQHATAKKGTTPGNRYRLVQREER